MGHHRMGQEIAQAVHLCYLIVGYNTVRKLCVSSYGAGNCSNSYRIVLFLRSSPPLRSRDKLKKKGRILCSGSTQK